MDAIDFKKATTLLFAKFAMVFVFMFAGIVMFYNFVASTNQKLASLLFAVSFFVVAAIFYLIFFIGKKKEGDTERPAPPVPASP